MPAIKYPNKAEFRRVCQEVEEGKSLTFTMIGRVFGASFYELILYALMDSHDAARAIAGAVARLKGMEPAEDEQ